jgi:hypothetical protein
MSARQREHRALAKARVREAIEDGREDPRGTGVRGRRTVELGVATAVVACLVLLLLPTSLSHAPAQLQLAPLGSARTASYGASALAAARLSSLHGAGPGLVVPSLPAIPASGRPNATYSLAMVYDSVDGYVVAVAPNVSGGLHNATYGSNDLTWKYSGGNWSVVPTTGAPPELLYPGLTFDTVDGYAVLFGGIVIAGTQGALTRMDYSNQTWSYAGGAWTNRTSPTAIQPPADSPVELAFDVSDGAVVLFDESVTGPATMVPTTWTYLAGAWTNVSGPVGTAVPPFSGVMAYDAADGYVVYFGGLASGPGLENWWTLNETWKFHNNTWTNLTGNVSGTPSGRMLPGMAYDGALGQVVMFGGTVWQGPGTYSVANDTWAYSGGVWSNLHLTTPGTSWWTVGLTYDSSSRQLLIAGETNNTTNPTVVSAIWVLSGGSWIPTAPILFLRTAAADAGTPFGLVVRVGPHAGTLTYQYSGLPPGCLASDTANLQCTTETPGRYTVHVTVTDAFGAALALATTVLVNPAPEISSFGASLPLSEVGVPVDLTAISSGGTGTLTYAYSGLPSGCVSADLATLACVPTAAGTTQVISQVTDEIGVQATSSVSVTVAARPTVTTFEVLPSVVDAGQTVVFAGLTAGGVGPSLYAYDGLPAGCATVDQLSFGCAPTATGSFSVSFASTDSLGASTQGSAMLTVHALPSITAFAPSDPQVAVGSTVAFTVGLAGGTEPYTYSYSGLPPGCSTSNAPTVRCMVAGPGNYSVTATVSDATGASVSRTTGIQVASTPAQHPTGPGGLFGVGGGVFGNAFGWGLGLGLLGLAAAALWVRRQLQDRADGEEILSQLRPRAPTMTGDSVDSVGDSATEANGLRNR